LFATCNTDDGNSYSYRERKNKEEKAVDVVVATAIYPHIFFFLLALSLSYFLCFFLSYYFTKPKKEPMYEHILPSFLFLSRRIGQSKVYRCLLVLEEHDERKEKKKGKHQLQNR
jgi:hypothetical protein